MPEKRYYGWFKDKYNPQAVYHCPKAVKLPAVVDLSQYCPPVRDQGQVGACTGFGIGGMAYTVAKQGGFAPDEWYSPNWLYNGARYLEGTLTSDAGAAPEDVFRWAIMSGLLVEHFWPYTGKLDKSPPSSLRESEATKYLNIQAIRVDNDVEGLLSALFENHCIALGSPWSQRWEEAPSTGLLPDPNGSIVVGGHETFYHGYDNPNTIFDGQNSWGLSFGDKGHYKMPFSAIQWFKDNGGYDAHYLVFSASPTPPPNPPASCGCPKTVTKMFRRMVEYNK